MPARRQGRHAPLALLAAGAWLSAAQPSVAEPVDISARPVPLNPVAPERRDVGDLTYLGGLSLSASDPAFGGLSGLVMDTDGRLIAVTDQGHWLRGRVEVDATGAPLAVVDAHLSPMRRPDGRPLSGKTQTDAEEVVVGPGGDLLVAFERTHRLWRYRDGLPRPVETPVALEDAPPNGGLEAVAALPDGRLVLITEDFAAEAGGMRAWIGGPGDWRRWTYAARHAMKPVAAAALDDGALLVLERRFSPASGLTIRLRRVEAAALSPGAVTDGTLVAQLPHGWTTDNFEALALVPAPDGAVTVWVLSDDNFSPFQQTLLMAFRYSPQEK